MAGFLASDLQDQVSAEEQLAAENGHRQATAAQTCLVGGAARHDALDQQAAGEILGPENPATD